MIKNVIKLCDYFKVYSQNRKLRKVINVLYQRNKILVTKLSKYENNNRNNEEVL